jgi:hypothetical protein
MTNKDLIEELKAIALIQRQKVDAQTKRIVSIVGRPMSLAEIVGESYVQDLATMTEAEVVHHLRTASGEKLFHAYLILSTRPDDVLRVNNPILAEVCLRFMASSKVLERSTGAGEIGIWLAETKDKNASHALALMISNNEETDAVRYAAYHSLELINNRITMLDRVRKKMQVKDSLISMINEIDWNFVRSFL